MEGRNNGHHIPVRVRYGKIGNISGTVQIGDKGKRLFLPYPLLQIRAGNEVFSGQAHVRGGYDHIPLIYQEGSLVRDRGVIAQHHVKGRPGQIQGHIGGGVFSVWHSAAVTDIRDSGNVGQLSVLPCLIRRQVQFRAQQACLLRSAEDSVPVAAADGRNRVKQGIPYLVVLHQIPIHAVIIINFHIHNHGMVRNALHQVEQAVHPGGGDIQGIGL